MYIYICVIYEYMRAEVMKAIEALKKREASLRGYAARGYAGHSGPLEAYAGYRGPREARG
jgi:hypothetical protein